MMRKTNPFAGNPFFLWTELALKTGEMMAASAQVITHRTGRMLNAGPIPNSRDRREFQRMGQEKLEAATESAQAMTARLFHLQREVNAIAARQFALGAGSMFALAQAWNSPVAANAAQQRLLRGTMENAAAASRQIHRSAARVAQQGLRPVHARATANAERLGRYRK